MHDVLLLGTRCDATHAIFHRLTRDGLRVHVLFEDAVPRIELLQRRAKRLGRRVVLGQVAFQVLVQRPLGWASRRRLKEIARDLDLDIASIPSDFTSHVGSVNSAAGIAAIGANPARVVVLSGTRIVSKKTLATIQVPVLNMHAGITPRYRGVHGGYWALRDGRTDLVGTTVHLVDSGIDTGAVLEQVLFTPTSRDNFSTYPMLHLGYGLPALVRQVRLALDGPPPVRNPLDPTSRLYHHPTIGEYLRGSAR